MTKTSNSSRYNDREDGELNINANFTLWSLNCAFFILFFPHMPFILRSQSSQSSDRQSLARLQSDSSSSTQVSQTQQYLDVKLVFWSFKDGEDNVAFLSSISVALSVWSQHFEPKLLTATFSPASSLHPPNPSPGVACFPLACSFRCLSL